MTLKKHEIVKKIKSARFQVNLMRPPSLILIFRKESESEVENQIQIQNSKFQIQEQISYKRSYK